MHCDDKRMLFVLKQDIISAWERLKESDFGDKLLLEDLGKSIEEYNDYKESLEE